MSYENNCILFYRFLSNIFEDLKNIFTLYFGGSKFKMVVSQQFVK